MAVLYKTFYWFFVITLCLPIAVVAANGQQSEHHCYQCMRYQYSGYFGFTPSSRQIACNSQHRQNLQRVGYVCRPIGQSNANPLPRR